MSDEGGALVLVEQMDIDFCDDALMAARIGDARVYAVISHMCDALGIDTQGQTRRIKHHSVLARGYSWAGLEGDERAFD